MKFITTAALTALAFAFPSTREFEYCGTQISRDEMKIVEAEHADALTMKIPPSFAANRVPVYWHEIVDGEVGSFPASQKKVYIDALNSAYGPAGFEFELKETFLIDNAYLYKNIGEYGGSAFQDYAAENRRGDRGTLNIYSADLKSFDLYGVSNFPWDNFDTDGLRLESVDVFPEVVVHEVGHWAGLYHTFQNGCSDIGDSVADTPAVAYPNRSCGAKVDSCPSLPGNDLVDNFMDYSGAGCMKTFTNGQNERIRQMMAFYRNYN